MAKCKVGKDFCGVGKVRVVWRNMVEKCLFLRGSRKSPPKPLRRKASQGPQSKQK